MKKSNSKSNKVFVPIIIVLAILTIAVIALTVLVRMKGGHSSSAKEQSDTSVVEAVDSGTEVDFVEDYKLDDYASKAADGTQTTTGSAKMDDPNVIYFRQAIQQNLRMQISLGLQRRNLHMPVMRYMQDMGMYLIQKNLTIILLQRAGIL